MASSALVGLLGRLRSMTKRTARTVAAALKKSGERVVTLGAIRKRKKGEEQVALSGSLSRS